MANQESDPRHHTQKMRTRLAETVKHLRDDIGKVDDPEFKAMFETSAEVLSGLLEKSAEELASLSAAGVI